MGPRNGIIGDDQMTQLPETQVPDYDLSREANMARFSKTKEFQVLKDVIESRIKFYQSYIPGADGTAIRIADLPNEERGWRWLAANTVVEEFQSILNAYQTADEVVKDAQQRRRKA